MRFRGFERTVYERVLSAADLFQQLQHGITLTVVDAIHQSADATEEIGQNVVQVAATLPGQFDEEHSFVIVARGPLD